MKTRFARDVLAALLSAAILSGCAARDNADISSMPEDISGQAEEIRTEELLLGTVCIYTDSDSFGTGFVYEGGYIVTNRHVVEDSDDIEIETYAHEKQHAVLLGYDHDCDIAVLKAPSVSEALSIGDSDSLSPGDILTMIGNPDGLSEFPVIEGTVLDPGDELLDRIDRERKYIWHDGNAVTGYSGGPVFDCNGKLVGIQNLRYAWDLSEYEFDNLCGIIPINRVIPVIDGIISLQQ